jgi:hypothetical protein
MNLWRFRWPRTAVWRCLNPSACHDLYPSNSPLRLRYSSVMPQINAASPGATTRRGTVAVAAAIAAITAFLSDPEGIMKNDIIDGPMILQNHCRDRPINPSIFVCRERCTFGSSADNRPSSSPDRLVLPSDTSSVFVSFKYVGARARLPPSEPRNGLVHMCMNVDVLDL